MEHNGDFLNKYNYIEKQINSQISFRNLEPKEAMSNQGGTYSLDDEAYARKLQDGNIDQNDGWIDVPIRKNIHEGNIPRNNLQRLNMPQTNVSPQRAKPYNAYGGYQKPPVQSLNLNNLMKLGSVVPISRINEDDVETTSIQSRLDYVNQAGFINYSRTNQLSC